MISREEALKELENCSCSSDMREAIDMAIKALKESSRGRWGGWIITEVQCPKCFYYYETDCYSEQKLNKCLNCGAKLRGGTQ